MLRRIVAFILSLLFGRLIKKLLNKLRELAEKAIKWILEKLFPKKPKPKKPGMGKRVREWLVEKLRDIFRRRRRR